MEIPYRIYVPHVHVLMDTYVLFEVDLPDIFDPDPTPVILAAELRDIRAGTTAGRKESKRARRPRGLVQSGAQLARV